MLAYSYEHGWTDNSVVSNTIYDVIIIGAGVTGCMTAYKLAARSKADGSRLKIAVVERNSDIAVGATGANSGIVHAGFDPETGTVKAELNVKGAAQIPEIARRLQVKYRNNGTLVVAFGNDEDEKIIELMERGKRNGVKGLSILSRDELRALENNISDSATSALRAETAGIVCPYGLAIAVAENAAINGVHFYFSYRVKHVDRHCDGDNTEFLISDGSTILSSHYVVNAAGTYAEDVALMSGEENFPARSLPRRGEYMLLDKSVGNMINHTLFALPGKLGKGIILSPTADGNIILGPNAHLVDKDNTATTKEGLDEIVVGASKLVKTLDTKKVITQFAGIRPNSVLGDFYLMPSEQIPGLLHLAGIESPGLASSPAVADRAVELLESMGLKTVLRDDYIETRPKVYDFSSMSFAERNALISADDSFAKVICRCETVTEGEIVDAIRRPLGARTLDAIKHRVRTGMGRCGGGFCTPRITAVLAEELGCSQTELLKRGQGSYILAEERF